MANSKPLLPASENPFSVFLMTFIFFLLLITTVKSDSISFNFPSFEPGVKNILLDGDANTTGGILQLTKKDQLGKPSPHSVGLAGFFGAVHLFDKNSGKVADFVSEFSFVVNPKGSAPHGDGFTFFIASIDFDWPENNTSGGFLGLFNEKTAFNTSKNAIVAVEFDSFSNEWDPNFPGNTPHIGIDINSIRSAVSVPWPSDSQPQGEIGKARISYRGSLKELGVFVSYPNSAVKQNATVSYPVDFEAALSSEWALVGFSAATGELTETHDILSWSFISSL
ncbi:Legume lectin domain [Sesbania bispinosa]|nr:Legume lectin domain [Sesbania bispinosa]